MYIAFHYASPSNSFPEMLKGLPLLGQDLVSMTESDELD